MSDMIELLLNPGNTNTLHQTMLNRMMKAGCRVNVCVETPVPKGLDDY
jgi:hypothetical protein